MKPLFFLLLFSAILGNSSAQVTMKQIGKNNLLFDLAGYEYFGSNLYSLDINRSMKKTNLETGEQTKLGTVTFKNAKFFFAMNGKLYIVETDGSLDEMDSETGQWKAIATMGVWSRIERTIVVQNTLYTIENGAFYRHRTVNADNRDQIGGSNFYNPGYLVRGPNTLHSLQAEGSLYKINMTTGDWEKISKAKQWKNTNAAATFNGKLYTIDKTGSLAETVFPDGNKTILDSSQFVNAKTMFATGGKLYWVNRDGNLFEIQLSPAKKE